MPIGSSGTRLPGHAHSATRTNFSPTFSPVAVLYCDGKSRLCALGEPAAAAVPILISALRSRLSLSCARVHQAKKGFVLAEMPSRSSSEAMRGMPSVSGSRRERRPPKRAQQPSRNRGRRSAFRAGPRYRAI